MSQHPPALPPQVAEASPRQAPRQADSKQIAYCYFFPFRRKTASKPPKRCIIDQNLKLYVDFWSLQIINAPFPTGVAGCRCGLEKRLSRAWLGKRPACFWLAACAWLAAAGWGGPANCFAVAGRLQLRCKSCAIRHSYLGLVLLGYAFGTGLPAGLACVACRQAEGLACSQRPQAAACSMHAALAG